MKEKHWYERKYFYNKLFTHSSKFDSLFKKTTRWIKFFWLVFTLLLFIFLERVSRIAKIDFERAFDQLYPPVRVSILSLIYIILVSLTLSVILGWGLLGIIVGISATKYAVWSFLWQTLLSDIYIFLMIFFSIITWIVSFYLEEYFEKKSERMGRKGRRLHSEKGYSVLGSLYKMLSRLLYGIDYKRMYALRVLFYGFITMILAYYLLGISL